MKTKNDINEFILTRSQFAKRLGKTTNAVRLAMRRGKYEGLYRFDGKQFLFKEPIRTGANKDNEHGQSDHYKKKIYRRGNHYNANYPNEAFRKYNEAKMLKAVNEKDPNFIKDYNAIRKEYNLKKSEELIKKTQPIIHKNYGRMLRGGENIIWENDVKFKIKENKSSSFHLTGIPYKTALENNSYDKPTDGSVEVDISLYNAKSDLRTEPRFRNKVDEEIWKLKNKKI